MRVLVACEKSNTIRDAFLAKGHDAWSCDVQIADFPNDNFRRHVTGDVRPLLRERWDLVIAHPPCTYLCKLSAPRLKQDPLRELDMRKGAEFFVECLNANAPRVCVENPRMLAVAQQMIGVEHSQEIQPWQFGEPYTKATRLWLKGLPSLRPTHVVEPSSSWVLRPGSKNADKNRRSKTFAGIAAAMAEQWTSQE